LNQIAVPGSTSATQLAIDFHRTMERLETSDAPDIATLILHKAAAQRVSDIHLVPTESTTRMQWRIDGVLHLIAEFDADLGSRLTTRFKVMAGLLTYRTDQPQEGRVSREYSANEIRVSTFPTLHGEKAALRLFGQRDHLQRVDQLGFPAAISEAIQQQLCATSGVMLLTGPSGSGKTTTGYACLREVIARSDDQRSVMTLEDPIEVAVDGATQSQVRPAVGFDLAAGLKALMRQDPDVILVGEIRDAATADSVFQAALTGHLVITTFHAGSASEAVGRLLEMGIEPYLMRSALRMILCQRLLRRRCECQGSPENISRQRNSSDNSSQSPGPSLACTACGGTGYHGRMVLAEMLDLSTPELARAILQRCAADEIEQAARAAGMLTLHEAAAEAVRDGVTLEAEVFRVLGRQQRQQ
jgi:general secretion pathway protein E